MSCSKPLTQCPFTKQNPRRQNPERKQLSKSATTMTGHQINTVSDCFKYQGSLYIPTQTMHHYKGNLSRIVIHVQCLIFPKWVPFTDPWRERGSKPSKKIIQIIPTWALDSTNNHCSFIFSLSFIWKRSFIFIKKNLQNLHKVKQQQQQQQQQDPSPRFVSSGCPKFSPWEKFVPFAAAVEISTTWMAG